MIVHVDKADLAKTLCDNIVESSIACLSETGSSFTLALSGGSIPKLLSNQNMNAAFRRKGKEPSFEGWHVFLADERIVPLDSPDSNYNALCTHSFLTPPSPIVAPKSYPIIDSATNTPSEVAAAYSAAISPVVPSRFDCVVLGMGEDGHTCSLFPGHPLVTSPSGKDVDFIEDSPKPPPNRITLTFEVLNAARNVIFAAAGGGKSDVLSKAFSKVPTAATPSPPPAPNAPQTISCTVIEPTPFPCAMIKPKEEDTTVLWLVDVPAAEKLL